VLARQSHDSPPPGLRGIGYPDEARGWGARIVVVDELGISEYDIDGGPAVYFFARSFREVAEAGALNSSASWGGAGGLALGQQGSRGPIRRLQG
jgi:hypothetical protein